LNRLSPFEAFTITEEKPKPKVTNNSNDDWLNFDFGTSTTAKEPQKKTNN
jgi:hypothetical protein